MYSTELIRKFPDSPDKPILYVVYNDTHIQDAKSFIGVIHGEEYLKEHVTVLPLNTKVDDPSLYQVYIDPMVYKYLHSWNN